MQNHEIKSIITLALPLMAAFLAQKGMQFIDTFMMGWIGPVALAASALGTSIYMTILVFCMGALSAVGVLIAHAKGTNHVDDIKSSLQHGVCLVFLLSVPCMLLIWMAPKFFSVIGEDPQVVENVELLLHSLVWGFPGFLFFLLLREFISAFSLTRVVMWVAFSSLPLTFVVNYILIYGKYGFPQLGISGIGYAGSVIMWFMCFCLLLYSKKHFLLAPYLTFESFKFDRHKLFDMLYIGTPSGILLVLESGMFLAAATMMGFFNVDALAAHQIAMQCVSIAFSIPFALAMATALQVGYAQGSKNMVRARRSATHGLALGLIITIIIAVIFVMVPNKLVAIFLRGDEHNYQDISQLASSFLLIAALFQCMDGVQTIANGALRGLKDTFIPMLFSIGCYWLLGVGSAYYFSFHTSLGALGIWYGLTLGICSIGIILTLRLWRRLK